MKKILIFIIFVLALFLRTYRLDKNPVGFLWDEAALGYNAYSILHTGRDEYGKLLPLIFKSFGDYKPGLYVYLTVPFVAVFGLNETATRLPSAVLGSLSVILIYFLVSEDFQEKKKGKLAVLSSLLLAISPWHLNFSRGAWELNVMTFELVLGIFLILRYLNLKRNVYLFGGALIFVFSLFTYQGSKFLVPSLLFGLAVFYRNKIRIVSKKSVVVFLSIIFFGFLILVLLTGMKSGTGRLKIMSLFSYPRSAEETNLILGQDKGSVFDWYLFHWSPVFFARSILGRYLNYFSGKYLFFTGDWSNPRNSVIYHGEMYYLDALFLLCGIAVLFGKKRSPLENFMLYWLAVAPIPAALTRDSISSIRSFTMVIPLIFIVAMGIEGFFGYFRRHAPASLYFLSAVLLLIYSFLFIRFLDLYFVHDSLFSSESHLYGYKEMVSVLAPKVNSKNKVVVTAKYGQPYIFYLFYTQYNPEKYQEIALLKENPYGDVGEVEKIGNVEFRKIYWPDDRRAANSLFVGDEFELPLADIVGQERIDYLKEIKFFNGKTAFRIVETK